MKTKHLTVLFVFFSMICAQEGARYLIITHDNFYEAVTPLADWKIQKGVTTIVKKMSEIGSSHSQIRTFIVTAYNTWNPRPEFLLLVGSPNLLPSYNSTDDYYANITGDYQIELCVGRFHCATLEQCSVMVAKTLGYEKSETMHDSTWFSKGVTIVREENPADPYYQPDARYIRNLWLDAGYAHVDSLINLMGHNQNDVINAIDNGRTYVVFRGSAVSYWWSPFNVNPNNTNNGYKLPVIISATCATMTLSTGENMLGDAFLRAGTVQNPKGAVGFFGTTLVGSHISQYRSAVAKGFFRALYLDSLLTMGEACRRAKFLQDSVYHNQDRYREWNLLGDPELNLWTTTPKLLDVTYDTFVPCHAYQLNVSVLADSEPVANAKVCILKQDDIYEVGYTNSSGQVVLEINPQTLGDYLITVTGRNCFPFQGTGLVRTADVGVLTINNLPVANDSGTVVRPQAIVKNFGSTLVNFSVNFNGPGLSSTCLVQNLLPDSTLLVEFDSWTLLQRSENICRCSTALSGDENPVNDLVLDTIFVRVHDVGVNQILAPSDTVYVGDTITPLARIENYGNMIDSFQVRFNIDADSGNNRNVYEANIVLKLNSGQDTIISFPNWIVPEPGPYTGLCQTELVNDMNPTNDSLIHHFLAKPLIGILEANLENQFFGIKCSPNPFINSVLISYGQSNNQVTEIKIYNASGKLVKDFTGLSQSNTLVWDGRDNNGKRLNQGIYFIQINNFAIRNKLSKVR
jgi:hypothetical protein